MREGLRRPDGRVHRNPGPERERLGRRCRRGAPRVRRASRWRTGHRAVDGDLLLTGVRNVPRPLRRAVDDRRGIARHAMTYRAAPFVTRVARPWSVRMGGAARHHLLTVTVAFMPCAA